MILVLLRVHWELKNILADWDCIGCIITQTLDRAELKVRPRDLKQIFGRVFSQKEFLKVLSSKAP